MFRLMNHYEAENEPYVTPLAVPPGQQPSGPQLQTTPWTDLKQLRAQEHEYLNSYGWVDETPGRRARSDREGEGAAAEEGHSRSSRARPTRPKARTSRQPASPTADVRCPRAARSIDGAVRIARARRNPGAGMNEPRRPEPKA
jgi:hypothetical protein